MQFNFHDLMSFVMLDKLVKIHTYMYTYTHTYMHSNTHTCTHMYMSEAVYFNHLVEVEAWTRQPFCDITSPLVS